MTLSDKNTARSILVVDDDEDTRDVVMRYFAKAGYRVEGAANGHEAISRLVNQIPDLVILDMRMPEMDGIGFLNIVRSYFRWATLPVILLTACDEAQVDEARKLGVSDVFFKANYRLAQLKQRVEELLKTNGSSDEMAG